MNCVINPKPKGIICGIDEVGRGPLAGPVFAAAVILDKNFDLSILNDSKALSEKKRLDVSKQIFSSCLWGVGGAGVAEIDSLNILNASLLAMQRAYNSLLKKATNIKPSDIFCIVDGNKTPNIPNCVSKVKADSSVSEVMAASIIAKVLRDKLMTLYSIRFPNYGYEKHKGYCTKAHLEAISRLGESPIMRKTFSYPKKK